MRSEIRLGTGFPSSGTGLWCWWEPCLELLKEYLPQKSFQT